ncbi:MAG: DUF1653 domain-containing protein [Wenzhouxiangellaceae bacterium]
MTIQFQPGVWRHFKGQEYLALGLARDDETDELLVIYVRLYARSGVPMSARKLSVWNQQVEHHGEQVPRFEYIGQISP